MTGIGCRCKSPEVAVFRCPCLDTLSYRNPPVINIEDQIDLYFDCFFDQSS